MARKFLTPVDLSNNSLLNALLHPTGVAPTSPSTGQAWYDSTNHTLKIYDTSAWNPVGTVTTGADAAKGSSTAAGAVYFATDTKLIYLGDGAAGWTQANAFGSPAALAGSAADGTATTYARSDHAHRHAAADHSAIKLSDLAAATADISLGGFKVTNLAAPTLSGDAVTKAYADALASGLTDFKNSVRVATTAAGTLATSFENGDTVDGVVLATGDRILIKNQAAPAENGIYTVAASGAPVRATDTDASGDVSAGTIVYVESGTANGAQQWVCSAATAVPWVPGTSGSTWVLYFAITSTQAGAGLTASGNVLAVGAGTGISVAADSVGIDTAVVARKYVAGTGPGTSAASWVLTHNLGNRDVQVSVYDATTYATVDCDEVRTDANTVTLSFASTVTANTLRAVVVG